MYPRCPHCGGILNTENDGYENYFTCLICAREFDLDLKPRRMTIENFKWQMIFGDDLTKTKERASMRIE